MVLDVGCGSGVIASFLSEFGASVIGLDANEEAIAFASGTYGSDTVSFQKAFADELATTSETVDKIYCLELIEHIYEEQGLSMLESFHRLLRKGGSVFLTTPNYRSLWPIIEWALDRFSSVAHLDNEQHVAHYSPKRLVDLVGKTDFRLARMGSMCFVAPWLAPLSWRFAEMLNEIEIRSPLRVGSILVAVLTKE